jgi:calcineurin-like phosphoesterase family protein
MSNIWFTADWHIAHRNIIEYCNRPWSNIWHMDEDLISNCNALVRDGDTVYYLGDLTMQARKVEEIMRQVHGKWIFIWGNHDDDWKKQFSKGAFPEFRNKVSECADIKKIHFNKTQITLCHFPMVSWNGSFHGTWHLYGHVHGRYSNPTSLCCDVGVDCWDYKPVHVDQIVEKITEKIPAWRESHIAHGKDRL